MPALDGLKATAALQLGTLGSGNHFVEFQEDEAGRLWLMLHSGSRGIGQAIRDHHQARATGSHAGLRFLRADSSEGQAYLDDLAWALEYADANRRALLGAVMNAVAEVLHVGADEGSYISCHHNHVRREVHGGETLWAHRKGAMPAAAGEAGLLPGSMGTRSFHEGRGHEGALCSSAHGAGRRLSRSQARRKVSSGELLKELRGVWFDHRLAGRAARGVAGGIQGRGGRIEAAGRPRAHRPPVAAGAEFQGSVRCDPGFAGSLGIETLREYPSVRVRTKSRMLREGRTHISEKPSGTVRV